MTLTVMSRNARNEMHGSLYKRYKVSSCVRVNFVSLLARNTDNKGQSVLLFLLLKETQTVTLHEE